MKKLVSTSLSARNLVYRDILCIIWTDSNFKASEKPEVTLFFAFDCCEPMHTHLSLRGGVEEMNMQNIWIYFAV